MQDGFGNMLFDLLLQSLGSMTHALTVSHTGIGRHVAITISRQHILIGC